MKALSDSCPPNSVLRRATSRHLLADGGAFSPTATLLDAHTFLVTVLTQRFYDQYRAFSNRFYKLVKQSIDLIDRKPKVAAAILSKESRGETSAAQFKRWITRKKSLTFTTRPRGLMRTAAFMNKFGLLSKVPDSWRELVYPPVLATKGS